MASTKTVSQAYKTATVRYAEMGVDTEAAMIELAKIPISLHCWQGDDVGGFSTLIAGAVCISAGIFPAC